MPIKSKKPIVSTRPKWSVHLPILDDLPTLLNGTVEALGCTVPQDLTLKQYRNSLLLFIKRNSTPPNGKRFSTTVKHNCVWVQLEATK